MKPYWIKTHPLIKRFFSKYVWSLPADEKVVYLTFDDGPVSEITEWVLEQLDAYQAKATFFCIGNNIDKNPEIFQKILDRGHSVGNHTYNHVNGWKTPTRDYILNAGKCASAVKNHDVQMKLFRPPYGKITRAQASELRKNYKIIMWDVLSADFDQTITPEKCLENVVKNIVPGSIVIFHDSVKAFNNLKVALPGTLRHLSENGYVMRKLD